MNSISVVIPCHNQAHLIEAVVQSVLSQTIEPNEIIVVDDCSTDESTAVIRTLPVTLLVHTQNQGVAAARNTGFRASSGEIILFIDSDAIASPYLIETLFSAYQNSGPKTGGVGGRAIESRILSAGDRWRALHASQDYGLNPKMDVPFLFGVCCSYSQEALQAVNGFNPFFKESVGEDVDIGIRMHKAGFKLAYHPAAVVLHQHQDTQESLLRCQYRWTYWNYLLQKCHDHPAWPLYAGMLKRLLLDTSNDIIKGQGIEILKLNLLVFQKKWDAARAASKYEIRKQGN